MMAGDPNHISNVTWEKDIKTGGKKLSISEYNFSTTNGNASQKLISGTDEPLLITLKTQLTHTNK